MSCAPRPRGDKIADPENPSLPEEAYLAALASLPAMGPHRLLTLFRSYGATGAWRHVASGRMPTLPELDGRLSKDPTALVRRWAQAAEQIDVGRVWASHVGRGIVAAVLGSEHYPSALADDPEPPAIIFLRGTPNALKGPRVAVVGTRNCTRVGREVATELGRGLAVAGVRVVSGLALGVDGAAHLGALAAAAEEPLAGPPVAVVAGGIDVVYPRRHAELHRRVEEAGVLVSEAPVGVRPERWRFPARNRIIAGVSDAVVVVESRITGGSMHTADEAIARGIPLLAVPGSVRSAASAGTNALLAAGATVVSDLDDVLVAIGRGGMRRPSSQSRAPGSVRGGDPVGNAVLDALEWEPLTFEQLVARTGLGLGLLAAQVASLETAGLVVRSDGWLERAVRP